MALIRQHERSGREQLAIRTMNRTPQEEAIVRETFVWLELFNTAPVQDPRWIEFRAWLSRSPQHRTILRRQVRGILKR